MKKTQAYDQYYQTKNLFGNPYPELVSFFLKHPSRGKLLDLGCGQGRNAIPLAKMNYMVTGIDNSSIGVRQMMEIAKSEGITLTGLVQDIYEFREFQDYEFILLDSMFHFRKPELKKESELIERIISTSKKGTIIVFCIQDSGKKIEIFRGIFENLGFEKQITTLNLKYTFEDQDTGHFSETDYKLVAIRK